MLNFVAAELIAAGAFVVALLVTWPTPPWDALLWGAIAMAVIAPFALYPVTKTLWIGIDIMMRPERAGEEI
jgi:ABC-type branched-subunit amino acid transport system permease subunit